MVERPKLRIFFRPIPYSPGPGGGPYIGALGGATRWAGAPPVIVPNRIPGPPPTGPPANALGSELPNSHGRGPPTALFKVGDRRVCFGVIRNYCAAWNERNVLSRFFRYLGNPPPGPQPGFPWIQRRPPFFPINRGKKPPTAPALPLPFAPPPPCDGGVLTSRTPPRGNPREKPERSTPPGQDHGSPGRFVRGGN